MVIGDKPVKAAVSSRDLTMQTDHGLINEAEEHQLAQLIEHGEDPSHAVLLRWIICKTCATR